MMSSPTSWSAGRAGWSSSARPRPRWRPKPPRRQPSTPLSSPGAREPTTRPSLNGPRPLLRRRSQPKAQRNFTDPDSKIMLSGRGSFEQGYNAQAAVDADHQVVVAADLHDCASPVHSLIPMVEQTQQQHRP